VSKEQISWLRSVATNRMSFDGGPELLQHVSTGPLQYAAFIVGSWDSSKLGTAVINAVWCAVTQQLMNQQQKMVSASRAQRQTIANHCHQWAQFQFRSALGSPLVIPDSSRLPVQVPIVQQEPQQNSVNARSALFIPNAETVADIKKILATRSTIQTNAGQQTGKPSPPVSSQSLSTTTINGPEEVRSKARSQRRRRGRRKKIES